MQTILLIDDNTDFRFVFQRKFAGLGYNALVAPDGVQGFQLAVDNPVDLILLDLNMPNRNGLETLRLIRSRPLTVKVVILTGILDQTIQAEIDRLGVTEIVYKPIGMRELTEIVTRSLGAPQGL